MIRLIVLLLIMLVMMTCRLEPTPIPADRNTLRHAVEIRVVSNDPVLASVFCRRLSDNTEISVLQCGKPSHALGRNLELRIEAEIENASLDFWRNLKLSLASLTTVMLVTTSADVTFHFQFREDGMDIRRFSLQSHGRIGVWGIQPPVTSLIGMSIGTALNGDTLPDRLYNQCAGPVEQRIPPDSRRCRAYKRFLEDGLGKVWIEHLSQLDRLLSNSRPAGRQMSSEMQDRQLL